MKASAFLVIALCLVSILAWAQSGQILIEDDFQAGFAKWRTDASQWRPGDGVLAMADAGIPARLEAGDDTWQDYIVEFSARRTVDLPDDGHWGLTVRTGEEGGMYLFVRPQGLREAGFGHTEASFGKGLTFEKDRWYRFQFVIAGGEAQVSVDGAYQGTVHGIKRLTGGIALSAYHVGVEFADLRVVEIPQAADQEASQQTEGHPLPFETILYVSSPIQTELDTLVSITAAELGLAEGQALPEVAVEEQSSGRVLPAQFDDLDGDALVSAQDEVCFQAHLPAGKAVSYSLRLGDGADVVQTLLGCEPTDTGWTITSPQAVISLDRQGKWEYKPEGFGGTLFTCKPLAEGTTCKVITGPARVLILSKMELLENARLTRQVEISAQGVKLTNGLASQDGLSSAFTGNVGGLWFDFNGIQQIADVRYRDAEGYHAIGKKPVLDLFPIPAVPLAYDLVTPSANVMFAYGQNLDYLPRIDLIGQHAYMAANLAFGWRPPIEIQADRPRVQEVWLVAHTGGMEEFQQLEAQARSHPKVTLGEATTLEYAFTIADGEARLALLDQQLTELAGQLEQATGELTPARGLLGKARALREAGRCDLALDRLGRALERIERGAALASQARAYLASAPQAVLGPVPAADLIPYVTFSEGTSPRMAELGFTVGHTWFPWGHLFEQFEAEPQPGVWNFSEADKILESAHRANMKLVLLANFEPPRWFKERFENPKPEPGQPPGSTGGDGFVSPELLGEVPDFMQAFGTYLETIAERYGDDPSLLAWSVRNEPAYYSTGGIRGELMTQTWRNWLARRYQDIADLNARWGTSFASLDAVETPATWGENRAAWWDVMTFKAECLGGELKWESDLLTENSACKRTGAKYVTACLSPNSARSGYGVDPWLSAAPQQGVSMTDLYVDDIWEDVLRVSELYWVGEGNPVIAPEIGRGTKPREREYRWQFWPDAKARSLAWTFFQHGLFGCHYWTWATNEEYACLDWDGGYSDFALEAALANQEFLAAGSQLAELAPVVDAGYYYPRASFLQGTGEEARAYQQIYSLLTELGYQLRPVSAVDFDKVAPSLKALILPPAPYLEAEMRDKLASFVAEGGKLIALGQSHGAFDEYTRPATPLEQTLAGKLFSAPDVMGKTFGTGVQVADLGGEWKFAFGAAWPQAAGIAQTSAEGKVDAGLAEGWQAPDFDDSGWAALAVPGPWEESGYPDTDGYGWYRKHFTLPESLAGKRIVLSGDTLDEVGWVYVNGHLVKETTSWTDCWQVEISQYIDIGADNVLAVRILDTSFFGGIRGRLTLTTTDLASSEELAASAVLDQAGLAPSSAANVRGIFRTLMVDKQGRRHLVIASDRNEPVRLTVQIAAPEGELPDLLSGVRWTSEGASVSGDLEACGVAWVPLWH